MKKPFSEKGQHTENSLYDVDFDDSQDVWEDVVLDSEELDAVEGYLEQDLDAPQDISASAKKSSTIFVASFVFSLCVLGGAAWMYYSNISLDSVAKIIEENITSSVTEPEQVSKLPSSLPMADDSQQTQIGTLPKEAGNAGGETVSVTDNPPITPDIAPQENKGKTTEVLTPLPDSNVFASTELPDLEKPADSNAEQISSSDISRLADGNNDLLSEGQKTSAQTEDTQITEEKFEENKLLSATEIQPLEIFEGTDTSRGVTEETIEIAAEGVVLPSEENEVLLVEDAQKAEMVEESKISKQEAEPKEIQLENEKSNKAIESMLTQIKNVKPKAETAKTEILSTEGIKKADKRAAVENNSVKPVKKKNVNWELRSAHAKGAMIADKASGQIISVEKGSVVDGIGRVVAIDKVNGRWVVKGTSGKISQ